MTEYTVTWAIQTDADTPEEAAQYCANSYFRQDHEARSFQVESHGMSKTVYVDSEFMPDTTGAHPLCKIANPLSIEVGVDITADHVDMALRCMTPRDRGLLLGAIYKEYQPNGEQRPLPPRLAAYRAECAQSPAETLRSMKQPWFSERETMDELIQYAQTPGANPSIIAVLAMNTTLELAAKRLEQEA